MCPIATFQCHAAMHPLCFTCWEKHYEGGEGKCPLCRSKLSTRRNIVAEKFLEKLEKKKCKFDACNFERNSLALVTDHEENCIHKTFKCRWSEHGCNFEAPTRTLIREHEDNDCEHNLSQEFEAELTLTEAAKKEKPRKGKRTKKAEAQATLMSDGLCWKHHKYGDGARNCDLPAQCQWDNDFMVPSTSGSSLQHRETSVLDTEISICKFHGCSFRNKNPKKLKIHEKTQCPFRNLSFKDCWDAAENGDINIIKNMVEYGREKNPAEEDGTTPLHIAASNGHVDIVQLILQNADETNPADKDGITPLHTASGFGHVSVVQLILQNVREKNPANNDGKTPLHGAAHNGFVEVVKLFLQNVDEKNPSINGTNTPLHLAALNGHVEVVQLIMQAVEDKNPAEKNGVTPLHGAAHNGHVEVVQLYMGILENKNPADKNGRTPLHVAARNGHVVVVQKILEWVNDRHPRDRKGKTPLQHAIEKQQSSVVQLINNSE